MVGAESLGRFRNVQGTEPADTPQFPQHRVGKRVEPARRTPRRCCTSPGGGRLRPVPARTDLRSRTPPTSPAGGTRKSSSIPRRSGSLRNVGKESCPGRSEGQYTMARLKKASRHRRILRSVTAFFAVMQRTLVCGASDMSRDDSTSTSLLHRAIDHQPEAWRNLVKIYTPLVRHWCRQAGIADTDVADISQEIFAAIATSLPKFRADHPGTTFRAWMRDRPQQAERPPGGAPRARLRRLRGPAASPADPRARRPRLRPGTLRPTRRALARLPARLRLIQSEFAETTWTAFWRVAIDNAPTDQVARELGITPNTVRQHKSRVLRKLKDEMGEVIA